MSQIRSARSFAARRSTTAYILIAIQIEEHDLIALLGDRYRRYRREVGMLLPWPRRTRPGDRSGVPAE